VADASLDVTLHDVVVDWLEREFPFERVVYAPRP
jgi:hypothetical protein